MNYSNLRSAGLSDIINRLPQILDDVNITGQPKDGVYIKGLHLEGAGWDKKNSCLVEANAMQLISEMPTIHFKPAELKKKIGTNLYSFSSINNLSIYF